MVDTAFKPTQFGLLVMLVSILLCAHESCASERRATGLLDFQKDAAARRWSSVPRMVLAFYYTWYGRPETHGRWFHWDGVRADRHEIVSSTHYPARGAYDSHDGDLIDYHIDLARNSGIDAFICTWWGAGDFTDKAFPKVLDSARKKDFHATVYWETVTGEAEARVFRAVGDLLYILRRYGSHPAFLTLDGNPIIFVYGRVMSQVAMEQWPEIITRVRERYKGDFVLIADGYREGFTRIFDGVHTYIISGDLRGKTARETAHHYQSPVGSVAPMTRSRGFPRGILSCRWERHSCWWGGHSCLPSPSRPSFCTGETAVPRLLPLVPSAPRCAFRRIGATLIEGFPLLTANG